MKIGKIASSAEYRMDEQLQKSQNRFWSQILACQIEKILDIC